jgi:hypothetical protein
MPNPTKSKRLVDAYRFTGFRPLEKIKGVFGDPLARVVTLTRRSKKRPAACVGACIRAGTTDAHGECVISPVGRTASFWSSRFGACTARVAKP